MMGSSRLKNKAARAIRRARDRHTRLRDGAHGVLKRVHVLGIAQIHGGPVDLLLARLAETLVGRRYLTHDVDLLVKRKRGVAVPHENLRDAPVHGVGERLNVRDHLAKVLRKRRRRRLSNLGALLGFRQTQRLQLLQSRLSLLRWRRLAGHGKHEEEEEEEPEEREEV